QFPTKAVYTALVVIVPFNALMAMIRPERGTRYLVVYRWLILLAGECLLVAWIAAAGRSPVSGTWWNTMLDWCLFRSPPPPPGRRALEERLRSLGERYAIAMIDVDHFKQFNDTHGHNVGDQVLKLVGARLSQVGGGGTAYRYGGEEFSVVFPDRDLAQALPKLEALRGAIERYRMAIRGEDRPKKAAEGSRLRGAGAPEQMLSVTVSIGAAGPAESAPTPHHVIKAADEALYRAKKAGRNRVSQWRPRS